MISAKIRDNEEHIIETYVFMDLSELGEFLFSGNYTLITYEYLV